MVDINVPDITMKFSLQSTVVVVVSRFIAVDFHLRATYRALDVAEVNVLYAVDVYDNMLSHAV